LLLIVNQFEPIVLATHNVLQFFSGTFLRENFSGGAGAQGKTAAAASTVNVAVADDTLQHSESEDEDDDIMKANSSQNSIADLDLTNERTSIL
jgi:hypothetical protein